MTSSQARSTRIALVLATLCVSLPACSFIKKIADASDGKRAAREPRFQARDGAASLAPVPVDGVRVVVAPDEDALPEGLVLDDLDVKAIPDYPSAQEPHRVLGTIALDIWSTVPREEAHRIMAQEAASHGANTLFVVDDDGKRWRGDGKRSYRRAVAVFVSSAAAPTWPAAPDLLASAAKEELLAGFTAVGEPDRHELAGLKTLEIAGARGKCYAAAVALEPDAKFSARARRGLSVRVHFDGMAFSSGRNDFGRDFGPDKRSHVLDLGCPQVAGPIVIEWAGEGRGDAIGQGAIVLQHYQRPIAEAELQAKAKQLEEAMRRSDEQHKAMVAEDCEACRPELNACGRGVAATKCEPFVHCMQRRYGSARDCPAW
jgi:hypothetical protein